MGETLSNVTAPEDKGHFMCSVNLKYVSPGWVRSESGAWHVVIQSLQWDIAQVGVFTLLSRLVQTYDINLPIIGGCQCWETRLTFTLL